MWTINSAFEMALQNGRQELFQRKNGRMTRSGIEVFNRIYRETAIDYFRRLGGAGRYDRYEDWHALALTIAIGLRTVTGISQVAVDRCMKVLPRELTQGCDGLCDIVANAFSKHMVSPVEFDQDRFLQNIWIYWSETKALQQGFLVHDFDTLLHEALFPTPKSIDK
jgi:hypothetical protein